MLDQVESIKEKLTDKEYKDMLDTLMKVRVESKYIIRYLVFTPEETAVYDSEEGADKVKIVSRPFRETVVLTDEELSDFNHFRYTQCMSRDFREACEKKCWNIWKELDNEIIVVSLKNGEETAVPVKVAITDIQLE